MNSPLPKVLVVEDNELYGRVIQHYLEGLTDKLVIAKNWIEAEPHLGEPDIQLVWIDLIIPGGKGFAATDARAALLNIARLRAARADVIIVVVSGVTEEGLEARLIEAGADAYIHKMQLRTTEQVTALVMLAALKAAKRGVDVQLFFERAMLLLKERVAPKLREETPHA